MSDLTDDELLAELGVEVKPLKHGKFTALEERIIAGFDDIQSFFVEHGHLPRHGEQFEVFERLYAVRLDRLRGSREAIDLLATRDTFSLLNITAEEQGIQHNLGDEELLSELGINLTDETNVAFLKHVTSTEEKRAAEEIANRTKCENFEVFLPLFDQAETDLKLGLREARRFSGDINIAVGEFFILGGQITYVAEKGPEFKTSSGETDARLRLIYSNATESNLLLRSLQRPLYKDEAGRRLTDFPLGNPTLFSEEWDDDDVASGTIYVLRSYSENPFVVAHREIVHKIGVTGGSVESRIANAKLDSTYLLADVEVVATYKLTDLSRAKLESLIHRVFASAQIDLTIDDRFGNPVRPKEWFLVPLAVIDEAVSRIIDGSISEFTYRPEQARLVPLEK